MSSGLPGFFEGTEMPIAGWWEAALWPDPAGVLARVGILPGMEVIDLCSGDGWFTLQIAKQAHHVVALDLDPNLLEVARHRLTESGLTNCDLVAGDAYELGKLAPRPVDFVFMANAFHGVPDRLRLVHAVRKTLKPTGQFAIVNWHRRPREETTILGEARGPKTELRLSPEQTIEAVAASGLKLIRLVELPPYHYGAVFKQLEVGCVLSAEQKKCMLTITDAARSGQGHQATKERCRNRVRSTSISGNKFARLLRRVSAMRRPEQMQQMTCALRSYSITSSERAESVGEISSCSALAVLRLSTNSILTDCWR